jgi:aldose 1-epimerase
MAARRHEFGRLRDGTRIDAVTLSGASGTRATIITYGATLQALEVPDRDGGLADVVLGFDTIAGYESHRSFFGATVGRVANRIGGARFTLAGREYRVSANDGDNCLHGGQEGFDRRAWRIVSIEEGDAASVRLALTSRDGDQGFPGELEAEVLYRLDDKGCLSIDHRASTSAPTFVNLTHHSLFNLAGEGTARDVLTHTLQVAASRITPVDERLVPTGELRAVAGTAFDFRDPRVIGARIRDGRDSQLAVGRGIDHNYVLDAGATREPKVAARLKDAASGRVLEVWTTEPGLQVYTGNFLTGAVAGKRGHLYRMGDGIALEPQKFPDSPNQPGFPSARLDPGETYLHRMALRFSTEN